MGIEHRAIFIGHWKTANHGRRGIGFPSPPRICFPIHDVRFANCGLGRIGRWAIGDGRGVNGIWIESMKMRGGVHGWFVWIAVREAAIEKATGVGDVVG